MAESNCKMVAALNIGTTYSGYAFSTVADFMKDPLKINLNPVWRANYGQLMSIKTPTCLLLYRDRELAVFGYEAENQYVELILEGEEGDFYIFQRFTTNLHTNENITEDVLMKDVTGKCLPASLIFRLFIEALSDHCMETMRRHNVLVQKSEVKWVITVSSHLMDTSGQILRSCAEQAGIVPQHLMLIPDTVSAFVLCQSMEEGYRLKGRSEYMIVHLGGFAVELTVVQKASDQILEKYRVNGDGCGATTVDERFFDDIFGKPLIKLLREEIPYAYQDLKREFESVKRRYDESKPKTTLTLPCEDLEYLCEKFLSKDLQSVLQVSRYGKHIIYVHNKMRIDSNIIQSLFKPSIDNVILLIENVFKEYKDADNVADIIMIGGFSNCTLVRNAIRRKFSQHHIIIPDEAEVAALKGAVLYGHQPCRYTRLPSHEMKAAQTSVTKCIFCDNPGIYHCNECKSAFCQECRTKHDKLPTTKTHTVTDLINIDPSVFSCNTACVSHKSVLIYFCTQCHDLICGKCVTTKHKAHDITEIKTVADDYRRKAKVNISELKEAVTKLSKAVGQMKEIDEPNIKRTSESAVAEVDEAVQKITKTVSFTKENKLYEVQSRLDIEIDEFQYDLRNKERIYEHQKNIYESLERLMHVSHDITFITSYETLKRDIHDISEVVKERGQDKVYKFDKTMFVQEVVNTIVSDFEMSLVGREDGSVVLINKTDRKKKDKE